MKIFNRNNLVLAIACFLASSAVGSALTAVGDPCRNDDDCGNGGGGRRLETVGYECDCDMFQPCPAPSPKRRELSSNRDDPVRRALRKLEKRGFDTEAQSHRRAKSCKKSQEECGTCVAKSAKGEQGDDDRE